MRDDLKRLAIVSDCIHMMDENGNPATENHIFCRQMQELAIFFQHVIICCPFISVKPDSNLLSYEIKNIEFIQMPNVGGDSFRSKMDLLKTIPFWIKTFKKVHKNSDIVYQRFPNNLNIPGFVYFFFKKKKVFATYTGTWKNYKKEPHTYRLQKYFLKHYFRGPVWAYISADKEGENIFKGFSPSYTLAEWKEETFYVQERLNNIEAGKITTPVFTTVGALVNNKNQQFVLDTFKKLHAKGVDFKLNIVGDGPLRKVYENFIHVNDLKSKVALTGKLSYKNLKGLYRKTDFLIQPSFVEGYGKVPVEGFFFGVVPLLSHAGISDEITGYGKRGFTFDLQNTKELENLIEELLDRKKNISTMIKNGRTYAKDITLEKWAKNYYDTIKKYFE